MTCAAAAAHYNMRNFDEAQRLYEDLLGRDPHRVEVSGHKVFAYCSVLRGRVASNRDFMRRSGCMRTCSAATLAELR